MAAGMMAKEAVLGPGGRLRVCLCISLYPPWLGGAERQAQALACELVRQGHAVTVVTRWFHGLPSKEVLDGVEVCRAIRTWDCGPMFGVTYVLSLAAYLLRQRKRFDVIQATYLYLDAFTAALLRGILRRPLVVRPACGGVDGDVRRLGQLRFWPLVRSWDRPTVSFVRRTIQARTDMLVALSCELEEELLAAGFAADRITRIPNGIDVSRFRPRSPAPFSAQETGPTLLFVGRLHAQKNLPVLLRAAAELSSRWPNLRVVLVGDGPERGRLEGLTNDLGLERRVRFAGEVPDVLPFLHAADLFVHPSRAEGMPGALLEAMACGLPCVATRIGGTVDIITDGEDGILIPPGDDRLLAGAIGRLLGDLGLARRLGRQARATVEARFAMDGVARQYAALYEGLVAGLGNRRTPTHPGGKHGN